MDQSNVHEVVESIQKGDVDQFQIILREYQNRIFKYCLHILGHRQEAEDATQEIFLKVYRNLDQYHSAISFSAWLYKIAYRQCIDLIRKRKAKGFLPLFKVVERAEYEDDPIGDNYFSDAVHLSLQKLSLEERNLLMLRGVEQKPFSEISEILNKNTASLRKKFERTVVKFKNFYDQEKGATQNETGKLIGESHRSL